MNRFRKIVFSLFLLGGILFSQIAVAQAPENTTSPSYQGFKQAVSSDMTAEEKARNEKEVKQKLKTYTELEEELNKDASNKKSALDKAADNAKVGDGFFDFLQVKAVDKVAELTGSEIFAQKAQIAKKMTDCYGLIAKKTLTGGDADKQRKACDALQKAAIDYVDKLAEWKDAQILRDQYSEIISKGLTNVYYYDYRNPETGAITRVYYTKNGDSYEQINGAAEGCTPLPVAMAETRTCIFCPLFKVVFDAANTMATNSYFKLGRPLATVMLIGLAIYIAFKVLILTSGFIKQDAPKFISEMLVQIFKVLVAYILLLNAGQIYHYAISPVLSAGLEFGTAIMGNEYSKYLKSCDTSAFKATGLLSSGLYARLDCFIKAVQEELAVPQSIGSSLICVSFLRAANIKYILPDFQMLAVGLIIWVFAWLVMLAFGFYLVDATIRIGIVGALMPFLVATWPFKATSKYASTGWGMLLNTFFVYIFVGIVIAVNVTLMLVSIGGEGGRDTLEALINGDSVKAIKEKLDIGMSGFLVLIIGCLFGFKLTNQASALAGSFASSGGKDIAPGIGGLLASGAKAGTQSIAKGTLGAASYVSEKTGLSKAARNLRDNTGRALGAAFSGKSSPSGGAQTKPAISQASLGGAGGGNSGGGNAPAQTNQSAPNSPKMPNTTNGNANNLDAVKNSGPRNGRGNSNEDTNNEKKESSQDSSALNQYAQENAQYQANVQSHAVAETNLNNAIANPPVQGNLNNDEFKAKNDEYNKKIQDLTKQRDEAANRLKQSKQKSGSNAVNAYVAIKEKQAKKDGKKFNRDETTEYAKNNLDQISKELDSLIAQDKNKQ